MAPAPSSTLERPPKAELGDYSTNAAMLLAPGLRARPARGRRAAARRARRAPRRFGAERIEVAGPGFLNLLPDRPLASRGDRGDAGGGRRARPIRAVEPPSGCSSSSSAPIPTGPLTVAGGRGAAYGDSLARLLEAAATRSSASTTSTTPAARSTLFAAVDRGAHAGDEPPEDGYTGRVRRRARGELATDQASSPTTSTRSRARATEAMRARIEATPGALRRALRHLVLGAQPARVGARSSTPSSELRDARPRLRERGRRVAAHAASSATTRTGC